MKIHAQTRQIITNYFRPAYTGWISKAGVPLTDRLHNAKLAGGRRRLSMEVIEKRIDSDCHSRLQALTNELDELYGEQFVSCALQTQNNSVLLRLVILLQE